MAATAFKYLSATGTASVSGGPRLWRVSVGTAAASAVLKIFNGTAATDPQVCEINAAATGNYDFGGILLPAGMLVDLSGGNAKVTVSYS